MKGYKHTEEAKKKMRQAAIKNGNRPTFAGKKHSDKTKSSIREKVKTLYREGKISPLQGREQTGEKSPRWIADRSKLKKFGDDEKDRRSSAYVTWRKEVWERDKYKCKIDNQDCNGRIEAHHILSWKEYPELRYKINNGITLCKHHHPRRREEEKTQVQKFQKLIINKKRCSNS